jgi:diacylglycerol O-acyltransferase / wax synthase
LSRTRLTGLDEAFLAVESPSAHMHVGWVAIFEPPQGAPAPSFAELRAHIERRLPRAPRYRQLLRGVPLSLGAPVWVDDPLFDVSRHVKRAPVAGISEIVDEVMSEPLPRDRPLWQVCVADRLDDGRIGIVGKAHHCMVDGIAAVELASLLVDPEPDPDEPEDDNWSPAPAPGTVSIVGDALVDYARTELGLLRLPGSLIRSPGRILGRLGRAAGALADAVRPAPADTPFNRETSPLRRLGLLGRPIDDLLEVKRAAGVTLNDVLLAVAAGGVRDFLRERGDRPVRLKSMVPANVRGRGGEGELGNRISFMFVDLPCDEPDALRRLRGLHLATSARKRAGEAEGGEDVIRSLDFAPSPVQKLASRFVASPRVFNLVVSNIPGPRERLFMRGCPLAEVYPVVPIADQHTLSIGVTTLADGAYFGLYADRRALPDVDVLAESIDGAVDELREAVGASAGVAVSRA